MLSYGTTPPIPTPMLDFFTEKMQLERLRVPRLKPCIEEPFDAIIEHPDGRATVYENCRFIRPDGVPISMWQGVQK